MPRFKVRLMSKTGRLSVVEVEAANEAEASGSFENTDQLVLSVTAGESRAVSSRSVGLKIPFLSRGIAPMEVIIFLRELSILLKAGLTISESLAAIRTNVKNPKFKGVIEHLSKSINEGLSFSRALANHPEVFDSVFQNTAAAGEASGSLPEALNRLSETYKRMIEFKSKVSGAMIYPAVVSFLALSILLVLFTYIIPSFKEIFDEAKVELPVFTRLLLYFSTFVSSNAVWLVPLASAALLLAFRLGASPRASRLLDLVLLESPLFGKLVLKYNLAIFTANLANLLGGGISITKALSNALHSIKNTAQQRDLEAVFDALSTGQSLSSAFSGIKYRDELLTRMVGAGERSGNLPYVLSTASQFFTEEVELQLANFTRLIEPLTLIAMGLIVGVIIVSIFLPIVQLSLLI